MCLASKIQKQEKDVVNKNWTTVQGFEGLPCWPAGLGPHILIKLPLQFSYSFSLKYDPPVHCSYFDHNFLLKTSINARFFPTRS